MWQDRPLTIEEFKLESMRFHSRYGKPPTVCIMSACSLEEVKAEAHVTRLMFYDEGVRNGVRILGIPISITPQPNVLQFGVEP